MNEKEELRMEQVRSLENWRVTPSHRVSDSTDATRRVQGPGPEFRRRIEESAARDDFQAKDGQRQLRELITDALIRPREGREGSC